MSARKEQWNDSMEELNFPLAAPSRGATEEQLDSLKERLLIPLLASVENATLIRELRWVANEASALAWLTACPLLVLPGLLEEKIQTALRRWERQQLLWKHRSTADRTNLESPATGLHPFSIAAMAA